MLGWGIASGCGVAGMLLMSAVYFIIRQNPTKLVVLIGRLAQFPVPEQSNDLIYYLELTPKWQIRYTCPPLEHRFDPEGLQPDNKGLDQLLSILHPEDLESFKSRFQKDFDFTQSMLFRLRMNGQDYTWYEDCLSPVYRGGKLIAVQGVLRNVQHKLEIQEMLRYRVYHDSMTQVHSREFFEEQVAWLDQEVDVPVTLAICDMDELKAINDTLGHKMGDHYIRTAASLLKQFASDEVIVSRIGGDEFAVLILNRTMQEGRQFVEQIRQAVIEAEELFPGTSISMSMGAAFSACSRGDMDELFMMADRKMYEMKKAKRHVNELSRVEARGSAELPRS